MHIGKAAKARLSMHGRGTCSGAEPMGPLGGATVDAPDCSNIASEGMSFDLPVPQQRSEEARCDHHNLTFSSQHGEALHVGIRSCAREHASELHISHSAAKKSPRLLAVADSRTDKAHVWRAALGW